MRRGFLADNVGLAGFYDLVPVSVIVISDGGLGRRKNNFEFFFRTFKMSCHNRQRLFPAFPCDDAHVHKGYRRRIDIKVRSVLGTKKNGLHCKIVLRFYGKKKNPLPGTAL
jgi:hypothetical protein